MELNTIVVGDCLDVMGQMLDGCVQCVVTSPPYWGLRDYGNPPRVWGGEAGCEHEWGEWQEDHDVREEVTHGKTRTTDRCYGEASRRFSGQHEKHMAGSFCHLCNAWLGCLGLEPTPELYVAHLVDIFREVKRVLRDDGTLWLNMGDSYTSGGRKYRDQGAHAGCQHDAQDGLPRVPTPAGLKPKDLVGIPWRVAFALQADGWWLRSDIIWHKPNCMPESVKDRPTKAHEYVFLLSKSKRYYYDQDAVREGHSEATVRRTKGLTYEDKEVHYPDVPQNLTEGRMRWRGNQPERVMNPAGRNRRTVWTIPTQPYSGAHFAVFPEKLVEPCIKAGSKEGDVVFDPFMGAGTAALVALKLGRNYYGSDVNPEYEALRDERLAKAQPCLIT